MSKVVLQGFIEVPEGDLAEVIAELPNHIQLTRKEDGCRLFRVERDPSHQRRFNVYEEFTSKKAFEEHQARVKVSRWGNIATNVHRNYTIKHG